MNHLYKSDHASSGQKLSKYHKEGAISIQIDPSSFYGIDGILAASEYLLAGKSRGKVVVDLLKSPQE